VSVRSLTHTSGKNFSCILAEAGDMEPEWAKFRAFGLCPSMCFVDLEKAYDSVPRGILWGVLWEYGAPGHWYKPFTPCTTKVRAVSILSTKSSTFSVGVGLRQGCPLSPILFVIFMERISRHNRGEESVRFGDIRFASLLFADDVILWATSDRDLQHALGRFAAE